MQKVKCEFCGKEVYKTPYDFRTYKLHFCCKEHFLEYRRVNNYYTRTQDKSTLNKIKELARLRKEKYELERG